MTSGHCVYRAALSMLFKASSAQTMHVHVDIFLYLRAWSNLSWYVTKMTETTQYLDFLWGLSAWDNQANSTQANSKGSPGINNLMSSLKENLNLLHF